MLKKLHEWFFKEDVEEYDMDDKVEEEDEYIRNETLSMISKSNDENKTSIEEENMKKEEKLVSKINIDIQADAPVMKKEVVKENTVRKKLTRKEEYEIPPVISPYFGVKNEVETKETPNLRKIVAAPKKESYNEVISPFYGMHANSVKEEVVEEVIEKEVTIPFTPEVPVFNKEEDDSNISLDQIISTSQSEEDDLIQFSLFGESKKLHEEEFENENIDENSNLF